MKSLIALSTALVTMTWNLMNRAQLGSKWTFLSRRRLWSSLDGSISGEERRWSELSRRMIHVLMWRSWRSNRCRRESTIGLSRVHWRVDEILKVSIILHFIYEWISFRIIIALLLKWRRGLSMRVSSLYSYLEDRNRIQRKSRFWNHQRFLHDRPKINWDEVLNKDEKLFLLRRRNWNRSPSAIISICK